MTYSTVDGEWQCTWTLIVGEDDRQNRATALVEKVSGEIADIVTFAVTVPGILKGFDINVPVPAHVGDRFEIIDGLHNDDCIVAVFVGKRPHPIGPDARADAIFARPFQLR